MKLQAGMYQGPAGSSPHHQSARREGGDLQSLRGFNRAATLMFLLDSPGGSSISELHHATALSRPTVELALSDLAARGLVHEVEPSQSTARGGRRARRFAVHSDLGLVAGAAIGFERVEIVIADLFGQEVARAIAPRDHTDQSRYQIRAMLDDLLQNPAVLGTKISALTVGVLGFVDPQGRVHRSTRGGPLSVLNHEDIVAGEFEFPVFIENDANLATTAEFTHLGRPEIRDMIGLHADVAIGCGLIINGNLHRGFGGTAGELGFAKELGWQTTDSSVVATAAARNISVAEFFQQAGQGVPWAQEITKQYALDLAPGLLAMVLILNPQIVVIGGAITGAGELFRSALEDHISARVPSAPEIVLSELGPRCISQGALIHSINYMRKTLEGLVYTDQPLKAADI